MSKTSRTTTPTPSKNRQSSPSRTLTKNRQSTTSRSTSKKPQTTRISPSKTPKSPQKTSPKAQNSPAKAKKSSRSLPQSRKSPQFTPRIRNQAFIDGQNLYTNTKSNNWAIDLKKFRTYLKEKYHAEKAYYFLGSMEEENQELYELIQTAGFILTFRAHNSDMTGKKKGNVDTDIVFTIMSKIADQENFDKVILVSSDGDYFKMVKYLIAKNRFEKLLAPTPENLSSLYKTQIDSQYYTFLDQKTIRNKIEYK